MEGQALQPAGVTTPKAPYSPIVVSGDLVLTARQVAFDTEGNIVSDEIEAQARQVFDNLRRCLEAAGSTVGEVVKVNAFLTDFDDFETYNDVYRRYFSALYPARTTVPADLAPVLRIEVEAMARRRS